MKKLTLFLSIIVFGFNSFAQEIYAPIDTRFFGYYQNDKRLKNKEIKTLMDINEETKVYMYKALNYRKVGLTLGILSLAGLTASLFMEDNSTRTAVGLGSTGVGFIGLIFGLSHSSNMEKAIDLYNKNLLKNQGRKTSLDFRIDPLASGLVLRF